MAVKCDYCGRMAKKYKLSHAGDIVCCQTCENARRLESYLLTLEESRERDEELNSTAYNQAREISAWLSVYRHGSEKSKKLASTIINAWAK